MNGIITFFELVYWLFKFKFNVYKLNEFLDTRTRKLSSAIAIRRVENAGAKTKDQE